MPRDNTRGGAARPKPGAAPGTAGAAGRAPRATTSASSSASSAARQRLLPDVRTALFVAESRTAAALPPMGPPEVAIAGRSNVGKSTLLNRLAGRHALARVSKTPGRTRGIVFFDLELVPPPRRAEPAPLPVSTAAAERDDDGAAAADGRAVLKLRLADLPGYGYAQVSRTERASWQPLIEGYAERRPTLALFVVLVDARRGVEEEERQLVEWLGSIEVPVQVAYTKVDKLSASERGLLRPQLTTAFPGQKLRPPLLLSGQTGEGVAALWDLLLVCGARGPRVT